MLLERFVRLGAQPCRREAFLEAIGAAEVAEDDIQLSNNELEELDLLIEKAQHVRLGRPPGGEVDDVGLARLPNAVNTPDALLDYHRIPGQLVVHEHVAELEIETLRPGAGRDEYRPRFGLEGRQTLRSLRHGETSRIHDRRPTQLANALRDQLERRQVLAEHDHAIIEGFEDLLQRPQLGVRGNPPCIGGELARAHAILGGDQLSLGETIERIRERRRRRTQALGQTHELELENALALATLPALSVLDFLDLTLANKPFAVQLAQKGRGLLIERAFSTR